MKYDKSIDLKWIKKWQEENIYEYKYDETKKKLYVLEMFSYPSGATLHIGHWFNFAPMDTFSRFKRMKNYNVFHPMGFDTFGLPAENYAILHGIHPKDSTLKNVATMKQQLIEMNSDYDWNYTLNTCDESYYKWTQWIFLQLYKNKLAYKKESPVNWCPSCNTVLANEQVKQGLCERCDSKVYRKRISQWFFKITDYAEELIEDLNKVDWPESTVKTQLNWIGKSVGSTVVFPVVDKDINIKVYTTRVDTLNGTTYVVVSPENDLVAKLTTSKQEEQVKDYIKKASHLSDVERMETSREKTGVFTGSYAINPINNEIIPVWIADYVLDGYGTGCVMAVPAHDTRDYEFANKFGLKIIEVIKNDNCKELPMCEDGILINSNKYNNLTSKEARNQITKDLEDKNMAEFTTNYRLKDWLVSRQRYWGSPIPIIYCPKCGVVPEKEENLPVKLPYNVEFKPDGISPLAKSEEFVNCKCPLCGSDAKREVDTLDTFVCSSWYYLRYPETNNHDFIFNKEVINKMLPVDMYVGGNEHAAMHLIYARFFTKALRDMGYLNFDEPFNKLRHQGMILGSDGNKMSKSKGNTVIPDEYVNRYGADIFRCYVMFGFAYLDGGPWKDEGLNAMSRYFSRIMSFYERFKSIKGNKTTIDKNEIDLLNIVNNSIKGIEEDIERLQFNTAVSKTMEYMNEMIRYEQNNQGINYELFYQVARNFIKVFAPFAPAFSEELWHYFGETKSVHLEQYPLIDEKYLVKEDFSIAVQVNGKLRGNITIKEKDQKEEIERLALNLENVKKHIEGKEIKKIIYVPKKIINIVII